MGCGAVGCEILKNFSMMGIGCEENGAIFIADIDSIERPDLNRHFLFRSWHIGVRVACLVVENKFFYALLSLRI